MTNEPGALGNYAIAVRFHVVSDLREHLITGFALSRIDRLDQLRLQGGARRQLAGIWTGLPV